MSVLADIQIYGIGIGHKKSGIVPSLVCVKSEKE